MIFIHSIMPPPSSTLIVSGRCWTLSAPGPLGAHAEARGGEHSRRRFDKRHTGPIQLGRLDAALCYNQATCGRSRRSWARSFGGRERSCTARVYGAADSVHHTCDQSCMHALTDRTKAVKRCKCSVQTLLHLHPKRRHPCALTPTKPKTRE